MNEVVSPRALKKRVQNLPVQQYRSDKEFLAAALEIIETPASPVQTIFLYIICAFAAAGLAWSYYGRIDIFAIASGKIRPSNQVKVVQPLETGRVRLVNVGNGSHVKAGDVLIALDPTQAAADANGIAATLASWRAEILRRNAAMAAANSSDKNTMPALFWPADVSGPIRARENRVLQNDLRSMRSQIESLQMQKIERLEEQEKLRSMTQAEADLIRTLQQRVDLRNTLIADSTGTRSTLIDALQSLQDEQAKLASDRGQLAQTTAGLNTIEAEKSKVRDAFVSENAQKLADAERQADDLQERLIRAKAAIEHMTLASPIDGTVQASSVTTIGQVVTTGQQLMQIVPDDTKLEVEAYAENRDIGFLREGQEAIIKVEAFPFTRYGTISGTVRRVARDSIPASDAQMAENDPTQLAKSNTNLTAIGQTQNLVYPVVVAPLDTVIKADGKIVPLSAGMTVTVEIKTGSRRLLEYLFAPLVEVASNSMGER